MTESTNGAQSTQSSDLIRLLKEEKSNWEANSVPDPDDPEDTRFEGLVNEIMKVSHITEINLLDEALGNTIIYAIGIAMVAVPFPHLRSLELSGNGVGDSGISAIAEAIGLGHIPSLESLTLCPRRSGDGTNGRRRFKEEYDLEESDVEEYDQARSNNNISTKGVQVLVRAFGSGHAKGLKVLTLGRYRSDIGIDAEGVEALAHEIEGGLLPSLEVLDLSWNVIKDVGIGALSKAFPKLGKNLKVLDLDSCEITVKVIETLAVAFMSGLFPELRELYVHYLGRVALETQWEAIREVLELTGGLRELARALEKQQPPKLQMLDLERIAVNIKVAEAFKKALRSNKSLLTLKITWPTLGAYDYADNAWHMLKRNREIVSIVQQLGQDFLQATNGKVFLCGNPKEGKTTLSRSLQNDLPSYVAYFSREKTVRETPRTRGIEVSHIVSKGERGLEKIRLTIWDLAGQPEYQVLQSAFLPDLAFADGEATTFVIVCNAKLFPKSDAGRSRNGKKVLLRWMKFIASSSFKGAEKGKRHVLLVLNRFNNEPCEDLDQWQEYLIDLKKSFQEYLEIYEPPFVVDARVARDVMNLKKQLIDHTRQKLQTKKIPKICQQIIQDTILESAKRKDCPIFTWSEFAAMFQSSVSDEQRLKAAADYLHQSGGLIHFREGWDDSTRKGSGQGQSLVVLDPDWFCGKVVGHLLLPDETSMLVNGEQPFSRRVGSDGSVDLDSLKSHLQHILHDKQKVSHIIEILVRLGICYMAGTDKVFIPALISEKSFEGSHSSSGVSGRSGPPGFGLGLTDGWVIGYCLKVQYTATTLLPIAVFRRLQVNLAQDPMCTGADSEYATGYLNIKFKKNGMEGLVEFGSHEHDPNLDDRVDILVKPLVSREQDPEKAERRRLQVDLAERILEKFVSLAEPWCPGVEFTRLVVKPWCTQGTVKMEDRDVSMSIEEAKRRVEAGEATTNWIVDGELVDFTALLSGRELRKVQNSVETNCEMIKNLMTDLGVSVSLEDHPTEHESLGTVEGHTFRRQLNRIEAKIDIGFADVRKDLGIVLDRQRELLRQAQALGRFSIEQVRNSVPRFMYITKRDPSIWMPLKDIFVEKAILHFICELHYDNESLHEVLGQEGVEIKNLTKLAAKILPWLQSSLNMAIVVANVAGNVLLPGLEHFIETFPKGHVQHANITSTVASELSAALQVAIPNQKTDTSSLPTTSTPLRPTDVNCNDRGLKEVLTELIGELTPTEFQSKFKLKRAVVNKSGYVVWICNDCFRKYQAVGVVQPL